MLKKIFAVISCVGLYMLYPSLAQAVPTVQIDETQEAKNFIKSSADSFLEKLNQNLSPDQLRVAFREILQNTFDFQRVAQMIFGSIWRTATKEEKEKIIQLLPADLDHIYFDNLEKFKGYTMTLDGAHTSGDVINVKSYFTAPSGSRNMVEWSVQMTVPGSFRVTAVKVDGVDFVKTYLQAEYNNDTTPAEVIAHMEKRIHEK